MKPKVRESIKVIAISAFTIGVLSAGFIGVNRVAFTLSTSGGETVALAEAQSMESYIGTTFIAHGSYSLPFDTVREGFFQPSLTLSVPDPDGPITERAYWPDDNREIIYNPRALGPDSAAILGAMYIWDMFGESIDGKFVNMRYMSWPSNSRTYWNGLVAESEEAFTQGQFIFDFNVDSVTGERIDIFRGLEAWDEQHADAIMSFFSSYDNLQMPDNMDEHAQLAKEIASRHFINSTVVDAEFAHFGFSHMVFDDDGNLVEVVRSLAFEVTDSNGRTASLAFSELTGELIHLFTQHNDTIPGFGLGL